MSSDEEANEKDVSDERKIDLTPDLEHPALKVTFMVQSPVVLAHNGGDRYAGLNGGVKCAFLKGEQVVMLTHRTCSFWE